MDLEEKTMILYFSGTGNSEYAAKKIARGLEDQWLNLFEKIREADVSPLHSERPWVIAAPTYAWRLPRIVEEWMERTPFTGSNKVYFVLTCGDSIGNAGQYLARLCEKKNMEYGGCMEIVMPENYIALFSSPAREQAQEIIRQAEPRIREAIRAVQKGEPFPRPAVSLLGRVSSGAVNRLFYPLFVHAKKFYATDACVSCGLCVQVCPLRNVRLEQGKPVWGEACTHCMACICRCPKEAIEYGKHSRGLVRYTCPNRLEESDGENGEPRRAESPEEH